MTTTNLTHGLHFIRIERQSEGFSCDKIEMDGKTTAHNYQVYAGLARTALYTPTVCIQSHYFFYSFFTLKLVVMENCARNKFHISLRKLQLTQKNSGVPQKSKTMQSFITS